jgi:hypothetical protein
MVTVRKTGNVCVVYLDEAGRPINFSDYDNVPEFGFPYTMDEAQAKATYGSNVHFIEPAKRPEPKAAPRLSEAQLREQMASLGIPSDVTERLVKQGANGTTSVVYPVKQDEEVRMVREASEVQELVIRELRILFAKYECVPDDPEVRAEVQYVVNFLLQIWPELEGEVTKMKEKVTKPRFKL